MHTKIASWQLQEDSTSILFLLQTKSFYFHLFCLYTDNMYVLRIKWAHRKVQSFATSQSQDNSYTIKDSSYTIKRDASNAWF